VRVAFVRGRSAVRKARRADAASGQALVRRWLACATTTLPHICAFPPDGRCGEAWLCAACTWTCAGVGGGVSRAREHHARRSAKVHSPSGTFYGERGGMALILLAEKARKTLGDILRICLPRLYTFHRRGLARLAAACHSMRLCLASLPYISSSAPSGANLLCASIVCLVDGRDIA